MGTLPQHAGLPGTSSSGMSGASGSGYNTGAGREHDQFAADELAIVLSHFQIGSINAIRAYPRGSRRAPKLLIRTDKGVYLLKRRARGKDDPFKVAFCHNLQLYLIDMKFPLPHLIGTKDDNNSMFQWKGRVYELFEYIKGSNYDNSQEATTDSGKTLALFHKLLSGYQPEYQPPQGSYHAAKSVSRSMEALPNTLSKVDPDSATDKATRVAQTIRYLRASYNAAAARVNELGLAEWPMQIVHGDWHPGNMLFRAARVVAVIDYDAARVQQRVLDVANGALQLSIIGGGDDAAQWPDNIDEARFAHFIEGYESVQDCVLARAELRTIPWLMIEALIAETVIPIAATGSFARMDGVDFLFMVERKVRWLEAHAEQLVAVLER